jgi:hypothetical protein
MTLPSLAQLQRPRRQLDTLRGMLHDVEQLADLVEKIARERDLTPDEQNEADAIDIRRMRLTNAIAETEAALGATRR